MIGDVLGQQWPRTAVVLVAVRGQGGAGGCLPGYWSPLREPRVTLVVWLWPLRV
jgi:hypothetical protein